MNSMIALIPVYEPTDALLPLVRQLSESGFTVIVVDDGSGKKYTKIFLSVYAYAHVISCFPNKGKGYALKSGLRYITESGLRGTVVTVDADGQHTVHDTINIAKQAALCPNALTLGVRTFGRGTPARSYFGNTVTRLVFCLSTGRRLSDTQTGLRAFGTALIPFMTGIEGNRYEYEMNMLMTCAGNKIEIREIPIETVYLNGNKSTHFHTFRDSYLIYRNIFKFAASSLISFALDYGLYSLLAVLTAGLETAVSIPLSNIAARIVSAGTNFALNKRYVFRNHDNVFSTGAQYFALAACILAGDTILLSILTGTFGINKFAAKIVTEILFFTFSFIVQRFWIFRAENDTKSIPREVRK